MEILNEDIVNRCLISLSQPHGAWPTSIDRYLYIQNSVLKCDTKNSPDFQLAFNGFYKVRRNSDWREKFYNLLEELKFQKNISFYFIINSLYNRTGRLEPSFSSKLFATLKPDEPVIDSEVLRELNLKLPATKTIDRLDKVVMLHSVLRERLNICLEDPAWPSYESMFDGIFSQAREITSVKKLDFILWQIRSRKQKQP